MTTYFKLTENNYIILIGVDIGGEEITKEEYDHIMSVIHNRPVAEDGYTYKLRTDLTWELCEVPVVEVEEEATEEDYIAALAELGVTVDV